MTLRCTCCGQWRIEAVQYALPSRQHAGPLLVLTHGTVLMGEWPTVPQLKAGLKQWSAASDLADFEEVSG